MALPWQADFYDCHKEQWEDPNSNEYFFMWWTAHRPDDVFPSGGDKQVRWVRTFDDPTQDADANEADLARFKNMQSRWHELKFVSVKNGDHYEEEPLPKAILSRLWRHQTEKKGQRRLQHQH